MNDEDQTMTSVEEFSESEEEHFLSFDSAPSASTSTYDDYDLTTDDTYGLLQNAFHPNIVAPQNTLAYSQSAGPNSLNGQRNGIFKCDHLQQQTSPFVSHEPFRNNLIWDQWLCCLATTLTPTQWQHYWMTYLTLFGTAALPPHLANFFDMVTHQQEQGIASNTTQKQRIHG
ncbi:hypothetical protein Tcan_09241 [Toxocara canis]|uniref:Uncharacterized protein n=1 Tax=Toxocara canis TaxID=6265 RepID=A0A0B2VRW3_TOXCA|nr:hypothetical protein Tcan_09241 [Toxocara canis]